MSRVLDWVVVNNRFPLGEKKAELMLLPADCHASGLGSFFDVVKDGIFRTSHNSTNVLNPAVAMVWPLGCRLLQKRHNNHKIYSETWIRKCYDELVEEADLPHSIDLLSTQDLVKCNLAFRPQVNMNDTALTGGQKEHFSTFIFMIKLHGLNP